MRGQLRKPAGTVAPKAFEQIKAYTGRKHLSVHEACTQIEELARVPAGHGSGQGKGRRPALEARTGQDTVPQRAQAPSQPVSN